MRWSQIWRVPYWKPWVLNIILEIKELNFSKSFFSLPIFFRIRHRCTARYSHYLSFMHYLVYLVWVYKMNCKKEKLEHSEKLIKQEAEKQDFYKFPWRLSKIINLLGSFWKLSCLGLPYKECTETLKKICKIIIH